jgi:glycerol kinase
MPLMLIGLDLGSSSVKALRIDSAGRMIAISRRPLGTHRGRDGRVEQDPLAILAAATAALEQAGGASGDRLGIATQRSTVLFWDRDSGRPLTPAYSWQDRRGDAQCDRLRRRSRATGSRRDRDVEAWIHERTGLRLSPHYSASKLAWALRHVPALRRKAAAGRALWGTLGTFLIWHMSAGSTYVIDHANAQRTLLFDLASLDWDPSLLQLFGLDPLLDAAAAAVRGTW